MFIALLIAIMVNVVLVAVLFLLGTRHAFLLREIREFTKSRNAVAQEYTRLLEKHARVQFGYDQGVLEGSRKAYGNVRAFLADEMETEDARTKVFLVTWLHPRLSSLGEMEHKLLMSMKGLTELEKANKIATAEALGVQDAHVDTFGQPCNKEEK